MESHTAKIGGDRMCYHEPGRDAPVTLREIIKELILILKHGRSKDRGFNSGGGSMTRDDER